MAQSLQIFAKTLLCLVSVTFATDWKCPDSSQWQLRAKGFCIASNPWYYCLFNENLSRFRKLCAGKQAFHKPDYDCLSVVLAVGDFRCPRSNVIRFDFSFQSRGTNRATNYSSLEKKNVIHTAPHKARTAVLTSLISLIVVLVSYLLLSELFVKHYDNLLRSEIETRVKEKLAEIEKELTRQKEDTDKLPKTTRDVFKEHIVDWEKDDVKFITTRGTIKIEQRLKTDNCVLVIGISGNGKSSILRHLALKLKADDNYEIIPIVLGPVNILTFRNERRKLVFVIDDFCGKANINAQTVDVWFSQIDEILKMSTEFEHESHNTGFKLLFAASTDIYNDKIFNRLDSLKKYVFDLSDTPLQNDEKLKMIEQYIPEEAKSEFAKKLISDEAYFPLLCKIAEGKSTKQITHLFDNLNEFIKHNLLVLQQKHGLQFCIITLCALFSNNFKEEMFACTRNKAAFNEFCTEFDFEIDKKSALSTIKEQLKSANDMYMTKTGNFYHFIHGEVYHVAELICGNTVLNTFIKFASSSAIAERFNIRSTTKEEMKNVILIKYEKDEKRYFDRLMSDLEQGITYSTFHNSQLGNQLYRNKFCLYCQNRKSKLVQLLKQLTEKSGRTCYKENDISEMKKIDYEDYIDFEKQYHFSSHKMCIPLIESAWEGFEDVVEMLLDMESDINVTDKFGRTALFVASKLGKLNVVILLLSKGANSSLCDCDGQYPLLIACKEGYDAVVKVLLKQTTDINRCDSKGTSPLIGASYAGKKGIVEMLVRAKADISICNNKGQSPLFIAASKGRKDVVEFLIKTSHAEISKRDNDGRSPLLIACQNRQQSVVDSLIQEHCNISQCNWEKQSPLFIACAEGFTEIVNSLVKGGANKEQRDEDGRTPLFIACERGRTDIVKILIETGADISTTDNNKRTPFYAACRQGSLDIVQMLKEKEADVSACTKWGCTPLFAAKREGHQSVVKYLLELGADDS
ncbi:unnamed protein product [Mytilus coruscus]|uniref:Novel STAND NTPase 3 domain-containing protein n=1 Tax=Mytilus coruscus TaxID=42192 RepID=A0A6J8C2Z1_MYTCO|nr:unnamed protein product [Mytilus coruscus]